MSKKHSSSEEEMEFNEKACTKASISNAVNKSESTSDAKGNLSSR